MRLPTDHIDRFFILATLLALALIYGTIVAGAVLSWTIP